MKKIIASCILSALFCNAGAQLPSTPVLMKGELQLKAGTGNTNPLDAKLKLNFSGSRFSINPYIGLSAVNRNSSGQLENLDLRYIGSNIAYTSRRETWSKGQNYNYGVTGHYNFTPFTNLSYSVDGNYASLHGYGCQLETLTGLNGAFKSEIDKPTQVSSAIKGNITFNHRFQDLVSSLVIRGDFSRISDDQETTIKGMEGVGVVPFKENYIHQDNVTTTYTFAAEYQRILEGGQTLNVGARYEHRNIESDNLQYIDNNKQFDDPFTHEMNVGAVFAEYKVVRRLFNANARLEYDYTDMNGKNLNDFIPSVRAMWHMTSANDLQFVYGMRLVRPDVNYLNPAKIKGAFTLDYGTPDLEGIHVHNFALSHIYKSQAVRFSTTVSHVRAKDGFNAIWMVKDGLRVSFWGNEGIRRQWSVTPEMTWTLSPLTSLDAKVVLMWDKRIAEAIHMAKEHWGITTHLGIKQQLPLGLKLNAHADYSEGNTLDLYSHAGKSINYGGALQRSFLKGDKLNLILSYDQSDYARIIITQGVDLPTGIKGYTGAIFTRPKRHHILSLSANWKF